MKKRLLALLLAGAMVFALAACGDKPSEGGQSPAPRHRQLHSGQHPRDPRRRRSVPRPLRRGHRRRRPENPAW